MAEHSNDGKHFQDATHAMLDQLLVNDFLMLKRNLHMLILSRQNEILSSCKNRNIPTILLTPGVLAADLDKLEKNLEAYGMQLAIPRQDLSQYF